MEKTREEIREDVLKNLAIKLGINTQEDGTMAVAIVDSVVDEIWYLYQEMEEMRQQAYLSTSSGQYTDLIAQLVNAPRDEFESDDDLKHKASTSILRHAGANQFAVEEAAMNVSGVASVDYRNFGQGVGSFIVYVYPEVGGNQYMLLDRVEQAIEQVVAPGVYFEVKQPEQVPIHIDMVLQLHHNLSAAERQNLRRQAESTIRRHINSLQRRDVLVINDLIQQVMNLSDDILDLTIINLSVAGVARTVGNVFPADDERFAAGDIHVA